ncbi:MAG: hypothetical protein QME93_05235 [Bacillota bacterium]|nr:hypothetical protein [Bacillota bacterium]MDI7249456.1 hypothetical protein [Bacillota bacterium]
MEDARGRRAWGKAAQALARRGVSLAWAVLDVVGFSRAPEEEVRELLAREYPGVNPDVIMITSTHNHEGPDTMGMWGPDATTDGKYPRYMRYLVKKIARGIAEAAARIYGLPGVSFVHLGVLMGEVPDPAADRPAEAGRVGL